MAALEQPIKVLCVDDSPDIAGLLHLTINAQPGMQSAGMVHDADLLLDEVARHSPDVIVLDLSMPGRDVLEIVRELRATRPQVRVIIYSGYDDADLRDRAWDAGAWGYVCKVGDLSELLHAVRQVAAGEPALGNTI